MLKFGISGVIWEKDIFFTKTTSNICIIEKKVVYLRNFSKVRGVFVYYGEKN